MNEPQEGAQTASRARGCELYGHTFRGHQPCRSCGAPYVELTEVERRIAAAVKWDLFDEAGRDEHAEEVGRKIALALGLTSEWKVLFPMHGDYLHSDPTPFPPRYATDDGEQVQTRLVTKWEVQ